MYKDKAYPYPEIVTGEQWTVHELFPGDTPTTNNMDNQMTVPLDRECEYCGINHSRMIRRHELGHAKWSPKTKGKLKDTRVEAIEVLEEIRINYLLWRNKLPISELTMCEAVVVHKAKELIESGSISNIILFLMASLWKCSLESKSFGYNSIEWGGEATIIINTINEAIDNKTYSDYRLTEIKYAMDIAFNFHDNLVQKGNSNYYMADKVSFKKVQNLARKLTQILNQFMEKPNPDEVKRKPDTVDVNCLTHNSQEECDEDNENCDIELNSTEEPGVGPDSNSNLEKRMRKTMIDELSYRRSHSTIGRWGEMEIHEPTLSVNLQSRLQNGRDYRPMEYGTNPKYIHRYCTDKKLFKQKQHVYGGTILIDASGSMRFNGQDILEIMQMLPAVTIAMYNGSHETGNLRVIARNGKRVSQDYLDGHSGMGNVVDGPALNWLATQKPRRIWVSDMHVFGAGRGHDSYNLLSECYNICTKNKIINLKTVEEVKEHSLKLNMV